MLLATVVSERAWKITCWLLRFPPRIFTGHLAHTPLTVPNSKKPGRCGPITHPEEESVVSVTSTDNYQKRVYFWATESQNIRDKRS